MYYNQSQNNNTGCNCSTPSTTESMSRYTGIQGTVTNISNMNDDGCTLLFELRDQTGRITNFIVTPSTYFLNQTNVTKGMSITVFYDTDAPAVLIYPPRYQAVVVIPNTLHKNVKVDYFDSNLLSQDKTLQLQLSNTTELLLENGQTFTANPANHYLIVIYTTSTRSIPAQTTPETIIVLCQTILSA